MTKFNILIVEDQPRERDALARFLKTEGMNPLTAKNHAEALAFLSAPVDVVVCDLRLGQQNGVELLQKWKAQRPTTPFVIVTAYGEVSSAVEAIKLGAEDYLTKPLNPESLMLLLRRLIQHNSTPSVSEGEAQKRQQLTGIIGQSPQMQDVLERVERVARTDGLVLILGESGTGKELVASAIHRLSPRMNGPFVAVNVAALPESLIESELFGSMKGAFTGAAGDRIGRFEAAHEGTLFIDEIGDFPLASQAKLLRVLENLKVTPVGSNIDRDVDVRVVAATSRNLPEMMKQNLFREDLFYRLHVLTIDLPPLRQRPGDISKLIESFLEESRKRHSRADVRLALELNEFLVRYDWPGNVRQLRNTIENMVVMGKQDTLTLDDLPAYFNGNPATKGAVSSGDGELQELERVAIQSALDRFHGNRTHAAEALGISVRTLQRKLKAIQSDQEH